MDDSAEADLAWDLADLACTLIPEADRVQLYITIGAGYNYSAINTLLGAVGGSDLALMAGPRELVHGERESFIGGYRRQHSGLVVGSPAMNAGGGGCSRASSRR